MIEAVPHSAVATVSDITASWLASALRTAGALPSGEVSSLSVELWQSKALSDLYRLQATYDLPLSAPTSFILKLARQSDTSPLANRRRWKEHQFYARVAQVMADPPVPRIFTAAYDPDTGLSHLLLEDLTMTHWGTPSPLPPTPDLLHAEVACLAHLHSGWWSHADLGGAAAARDEAWIAARAASVQRRLERFLAAFGHHLPAAAHAALSEVAAAWPAILSRTAKMPLTVVHGDAHPWNFLNPHDWDSGRTYLLDWEGWSIEPGPHDLASLIALHLPVSERRAVEEALLARYVTQLEDHGVLGYGMDACGDDYRRAVARRVLSPVGLWARGAKARAWWPALEHISAAYHDLRCADLF